MPEYTLLLIEATGIQPYIFGSNNLAQNIGASERVTQATTRWVFEALDALNLAHNVPRPNGSYAIDAGLGTYAIDDESISGGRLGAEVIFAGGGNALLLFADRDRAKQFVKKLTGRVLVEAPGLSLAVASTAFAWNAGRFGTEYEGLRRTLARRKGDRAFSAPLAGLGVTAACVFTGLPAVGTDDERPTPHLVSSVVRAKLDAENDGLERLHAVLPAARKQGFGFVYDFDLFGTRGESSYIAVVHTDGNGMGDRIGHAISDCRTDDECVSALRKFSLSVNKAATAALRATLDALINSRDQKGRFGGVVPTPKTAGRPQLPFRPIVFGGDDVTFVCEGRLGLTLAATYLDAFSRQLLSDGKPAHARAGIAVVKSHFPFSRAYDLAEELCASAKKYITDRRSAQGEENLTAMDWHFAVTGLVHDLEETRAREYRVPTGKLFMRPYRLTDPDRDRAHSWESFLFVANEFKRPGGNWADKRNKVKALRDALRGGTGTTEQFLRAYRLKSLPDIPGYARMTTQGWDKDAEDKYECGYFDAIEAVEFLVPLQGGARP